MRATLAIAVVVLTACPNGAPRVGTSVGNPHGDDAGQQTAGCLTDDACGAGQVCVNCSGVGECTPGCRADSQCGERDVCQLGTQCQTCPCPPGWCILNPCRDDDSDGFVPGDDPLATCPGKQKGDCDDRRADVHPGAVELCKNYRDDNCDGKYDERDPTCVCEGAAERCNDSWECGGVGTSQCNKGCCEPCSMPTKPTCNFGGGQYCAQRYGANPVTGCSYGWTCDVCGSCGTTVAPVCGANGSTYDNLCLLNLRRTSRLHDGECLPGEGMYCDGPVGAVTLDGGCGPSGQLYCRKSCPSGTTCGYSQCTKKGVCLADSDCPAGEAAPTPADCDGGTPVLRCVSNACVSSCT
ncbi:MAG: putative metal-binding motif-containing protein [Myxococcaceae bacterium]|nr:putative metal-binding motif-containing protein [Myxococcaceae bacterium]